MIGLKKTKKTFRMLNERPVQIVADAAIAAGTIGDGRLIPLIILDTTDRPDLEELIRVQQYVKPGDVISQWGTVEDGSDRVGLLLTFEGTMNAKLLLIFDVMKQGMLIDQIIRVRGLYLQAGRPGDTFLHDTEKPKLIAEIPETGFERAWNDLFYKTTVKNMRANGMSRREAKNAARSYIDELRTFGGFRMKFERGGPRELRK